MVKLLTLVMLLASSMGFAAHLKTNIQCVDFDEDSKLKMVFQHVKANDLQRLQVDFDSAKGGVFNAGDVLEVLIEGESVGTLRLRSVSPTALKGTFKIQAKAPLPFVIKRGTAASVSEHSCVFKRR